MSSSLNSIKISAAAFLIFGSAALGCASTPPPAPEEKPAEVAKPAEAAKPAAPAPVWSSLEAFNARCTAAQTQVQAIRESIKAATEKSEVGVLIPTNMLYTELDVGISWMDLMANTLPDKAARDEAEKCSQTLKQLATDLSLDRGLYDAIVAVDVAPLDADGKRFVEKIVRNFKRSGVDKDEATRTKLKDLQTQMIQVGQDFDRNIREDVKTIEVDPKELDGLPEDFIKAHKPNAAGKIVLTTNYPDFFPVQTYAKNEEVRKKLVVAFFNRAAPANDAKLKRILELRYEYAKTLGYPSWAEYNAEDKMAKNAATIKKFIDDLAKMARPRMNADLKDLLARKKKDDKKAKAIEVWDRFYYVDRVRSEKYGLDSKAVRTYFEFRSVEKGLFELYGELFGLRFEKIEAPVWHESVSAYRMYADGKMVGSFYLDLHPRDGKYGHAAMFPLVAGSSDGVEPQAALVCNFPDPSKSEGPALMQHSDVRTFFHEFGHLIHHLLAKSSKWSNQNGVSVEWDFVEAPSQLLEEWIWDVSVLGRFAKNEAGEAIPAELVNKLRAAEEFGKGTNVMRQLKFASLSYELHARDPKGLDLVAFQKDIDKKLSPFPYPAGTYEYASFGHLEGYSSMYYTYQWSLVMAKDIFTRFAKAGLLDRATASEYRDKILVPGGRKDAAVLMKDFLGREASLDAYRIWLERN